MNPNFQAYAPRSVRFHDLVEVDGWRVKVYTISVGPDFQAAETLSAAISQLPNWLSKAGDLALPTYHSAFLIVHEGRDGAWSILSWWIGGEMLQTTTFFTPFSDPSLFLHRPDNSSMACVWELAVICHERQAWIDHILKKAAQPDWEAYWAARLEGEL